MQIIKPTLNNEIEIDDNKKLSKDEFKRIIELCCFSTVDLLTGPKKAIFNCYVNFAGLILAKRSLGSKWTEVFVLVPFRFSTPIFGDNKSFILDYIQNTPRSVHKGVFSAKLIKALLDQNYLISVQMYDNYATWMDSVPAFQVVSFYNVHLKKDRKYAGCVQYFMHGGSDHGRGAFQVDEESFLGMFMSNIYIFFMKG